MQQLQIAMFGSSVKFFADDTSRSYVIIVSHVMTGVCRAGNERDVVQQQGRTKLC